MRAGSVVLLVVFLFPSVIFAQTPAPQKSRVVGLFDRRSNDSFAVAEVRNSGSGKTSGTLKISEAGTSKVVQSHRVEELKPGRAFNAYVPGTRSPLIYDFTPDVPDSEVEIAVTTAEGDAVVASSAQTAAPVSASDASTESEEPLDIPETMPADDDALEEAAVPGFDGENPLGTKTYYDYGGAVYGEVNHAPVLGSFANPTVVLGQTWSITLADYTYDPDGDALNFSAYVLPSSATMDAGSGHFVYRPQAPIEIGVHEVTIMVTDSRGAYSQGTFYINVVDAGSLNLPPVLSSFANPTVRLGETWSIRLSDYAYDPEGSPLTFTAYVVPANGSLEPNTGLFTYRPERPIEIGVHEITILVKDSGGAQSQGTFYIEVVKNQAANQAPVLGSFANPTVKLGEKWSIKLSDYATDPDGDRLTFTAYVVPANASLEPNSGLFTYQPERPIEIGVHEITILVKDGRGGQSQGTFYINVIKNEPPNAAPQLGSFANPTVRLGQTWTIRLSNYVYDADGDALTFTAYALPATASLESRSGYFVYRPVRAIEIGVHPITIKVTDARGASAQGTFLINVTR